ncbi:MAG: elongation factor G [Oscillospiraceae bacterium]
MSYTTQDIRNICVLGHGGDGKTSLVESMLFLTKGTDRLGKVTDGNTVSDSDPEEIKRQISISASMAPITHKSWRLNVIDTPGYFDFAGEVMQALRVCESGLVVCTAKNGISVGTEKSWKYLSARKLPKLLYISKIDEEHADFYKTFSDLRERFGVSVCPVVIPIVEGDKVSGIVNLIEKKAYKADGGKVTEIPVPASMDDRIAEYSEMLKENIAETSEEMMEKFFGGEDFTLEEMKNGVRAGVRDLSLVPVFCGSAFSGLGTEELLTGIGDFAPNPLEGKAEVTEAGELKAEPDGPACLFVFKTVSDQYGKFSYFKVVAGKATPDMALTNARTGSGEKLGRLYSMKGKKSEEVREVICGDIAAAAKMAEVKTGDTLCDSKRVVKLAPVEIAEPCYSMAIAPKTKGQEDKVATGLSRLAEEDLSFTYQQNAETRQMVVSGAGDIHLDVICSKLKNRFGVEVELTPARVPYREKIRKKVRVQGRHKKQSGGHGQFGDVWIEFEPGEQEDLDFSESIFGGSVPKNFFPAVEKGLRESMAHGVLAGYPVVNLKATLVDGSYHPVDSSEMAFKTAASLAYKAGLTQANPVLLEPVGLLKVTVPDAYTGDIMGDLSKRRGRPLGMTPDEDGNQVIEAEVPMGEMSSYAIDLRSMTQSRGSFTFKFIRYEEAPATVQQKAIEEAKLLAEGE